eukprot:766276_1
MDVIRPEGHKCDDNDSMSSTAMSSITAGTPGRADTITISNDEVIGNGKAKQSKKRKIECLDTVPIRIAKKAKTRPILRGGWGNLLNRQGDTAKTSKSKRKTKQKTLKGNKTKTNQQKQDAKTLKKGMAPRKDGKAYTIPLLSLIHCQSVFNSQHTIRMILIICLPYNCIGMSKVLEFMECG